MLGVIGASLGGAAYRISWRQVGRHALGFFYDSNVAFERKAYAAPGANAGRNTIVCIQRVAILSGG
jgi:hypothetical protein